MSRKGVNRPVCVPCDRKLWSHGPDRWICPKCGTSFSKSPRPAPDRRLILNGSPPKIVEGGKYGYPIRADSRGRQRVQLGKGHPWANSGGWQYLSRVLVSAYLGRDLHTDEQVDHLDEDRTNDRIDNLRLVINPEGRRRWNHTRQRDVLVLAEWCPGTGKFVEHQEPLPF